MAVRGTRRIEPDRDDVPGGHDKPPESEHVVKLLQRAAGNAAVARLLARQPTATATALPPNASRLGEFRKWAFALRALGDLGKPAVSVSDIKDANVWMAKVTMMLELAKGIGDRIDLHAESSLAPDELGSEYGAAVSELPELIRPAMQRAEETAMEIAALVMTGMNATSVAGPNADAEPALMPPAQVDEWHRDAKRLHALGAIFTTMGVQDAAAACQEAALAMLQARSVASARATWRAGDTVEATVAGAKDPRRARSAVDDIFADSGFATKQAVEKVTSAAGVESEQIFDWCGMFVAAGMFRGAGLDKDMRKAFAHTDNVYDFFNYTAHINDERTPLSIWADGRWWLVSDYHLQRGVRRTWMEKPSIDLAKIRPGDVLLIRHWDKKPDRAIANHIVMVDSFDPATGRLVTIEGNIQEGIRPDAEGDATRVADGGLANAPAERDASVVHVRNMQDQATTTPDKTHAVGPYVERGGRTVFGVGRPSLVDFEDHEYAKQAVPKALETMSPDEMRRNAANAGRLQPRSPITAANSS